MLRREWFRFVDQAPPDLLRVRFWDLVAIEARAEADPDYTAGVLLGWASDGGFYILAALTAYSPFKV
jgi:phage terminase large subunit-like protein